MSVVTPRLKITGTGTTLKVVYTENEDANSHLVWRDGTPVAVPLDKLSKMLPGWQNMTALEVAQAVAGMP